MDPQLKQWAFAKFGASSQAAKDMGFAPRKVAKRTVETKQHAVQQSIATREARHTMGKKQRSRIKGVVVAPIAPAEPAVVEAPAAPPATPSSGTGANTR
jgi:hypothetical protein